ncbi:MAG: hypothetical protein WCJ64_02045 [Rhodospirillaceae bacterium]
MIESPLTNRDLAAILEASEARVSDARLGKARRVMHGLRAIEYLWPRLPAALQDDLRNGRHLEIGEKTARRRLPPLDFSNVSAVADELGLDVRPFARGGKSGGLWLLGHRGSQDQKIDISCAGPKVWITMTTFNPQFKEDKWCMPSDEVGPANIFLANVLQTRAAENDDGHSCDYSLAISLVLGIDALGSHGYTSGVLRSRRKAAV